VPDEARLPHDVPKRNTDGGQLPVRSGQLRRLFVVVVLCLLAGTCRAQDLVPRAYIITPIHSNAILLTYSFLNGDIVLNPTLPISNAKGKLNVPVFSYFHTFNFFGRSANITGSLPYAAGHFQGDVNGVPQIIYRSGLLDSAFRFSFNLKGGPAMDLKQYLSWKHTLIVGASVTVTAPTGQYDPTRLVNPGTNRWSIKPEVGISRRWGKWVLDGYGGVWFFTENHEFFSHNQTFPGTNTQSQNPLGAVQVHLSYDFRRALWISGDANFLCGGSTSLNHVSSPGTFQSNSRIGATASLPFAKHQSLKVSYSYGAYIRVGGNFHAVSVGWQYSWLGKPQ
jgi:Putative MetA-pathway of phenol degradation